MEKYDCINKNAEFPPRFLFDLFNRYPNFAIVIFGIFAGCVVHLDIIISG